MKNDDVIDTLNDLIQTCNDGNLGFKTCAESTKCESARLKSMFVDRANGCSAAAAELKGLVRTLGGTPTESATASGAIHRGWLNLKTAIAGNSDRAVLDECERGEDVAKAAYQKALAQDLPAAVRTVVERQYQGVLRNHELIKELRNEARAEQT